MLGVRPGALVSDAKMMAIETTKQRDMMEESLGDILKLFNGEVVTIKQIGMSSKKQGCK